MLVSSTSKKIRQKLNLKRYLDELTVLIGRPVLAAELLSLERTAEIQEAAKIFSAQDLTSSEIAFSEKYSERFQVFLEKLSRSNSSPVYIWTSRTNDCGAFLTPSLSEIKFYFDFNVNEEGILVILTKDLADRLILDFFSLSTGEQRLKIETQGSKWGQIRIEDE